ncbi:MAG TPA: ATP synthase F1 subunit gamma [Candidatus Angelobacter sp.]|jgi:F-type H+-transporting ATPase subunit gamma|nr:ATP synthase F1 subunit gamma [Candidatus Angelobacter sp.]
MSLGLKEIKGRIHSVSSIMQITSAMKVVSASKLKKYGEILYRICHYVNKLEEILKKMSYSWGRNLSKKSLFVVFTSHRGLCGTFNTSIFRMIENLLKTKSSKEIHLMIIGKKGIDFFEKKKYKILNENKISKISILSKKLMQKFFNMDFFSIDLAYNTPKSLKYQKTIRKRFLPFSFSSRAYVNFLFEPSKERIFDSIIPMILRINFIKAFLESTVSENTARMTSMHIATENASDLKSELTLSSNKIRQEAITKEILEIIGGTKKL